MVAIPVKNGTHSIVVHCASMTSLKYDSDTNIYSCEYSDWAFGLFAILAVLLILIPLILIIHCWVKWYHKEQAKHFHPSYSRQSSYSSLRQNENNKHLNNVLDQEADVLYHHPRKKQGKSYYPYPAYGTCDENSLPGSTSSIYYDQEDDPSKAPNMSVPASTASSEPKPSYLSTSAPVVPSVLIKSREDLHANQRALPSDIGAFSSLDNKNSHDQSEQTLFRKLQIDDASQGSLKSNPKTLTSETTSSSNLTLSDSTPGSDRNLLIDFDYTDGKYKQVNNAREKGPTMAGPSRTHSLMGDKSRILSATPPTNMTTRQDFDNYLVDCVSKLPEDQRNGTFLIRNSTTLPNCKVLTLYSKSLHNNATLYYFKILYSDDGTLRLENTAATFTDINAFIGFHKENRSILPCLLVECLGRNF